MNEVLLEKARSGNLEARNEIIEQSLGVIDKVCKKLWRVKCDESAKRYGALLGIIHAIKLFQPKYGSWENYAFWCAYGTAKREVSKDYLVKCPQPMVDKRLEEGMSPCETVSLSSMFEKMGWIEYSYALENGDDISTRVATELIINEDIPETQCLNTLNICLGELTEIERDAIYHRYKYDGSTLKQVGVKHNVSHEWVRLTSAKAFKKLKLSFFKQLKKERKIWDTKSS